MVDFGKRMHAQSFVLCGHLSDDHWQAFLLECATAMGMTPAGQPAVWHYPLDGKGGCGQTIFLPITESFLVVDTWPDHVGAYLHIASCKDFTIHDLRETIQRFELTLYSAGDPAMLEIP